MSHGDFASIFGRHEFLIRRLHSLTGLVPIGGYLIFHLATNAAIIDGLDTYQHRADQIHQLGATTILFLEWSLIFLPILFHGLIGMVIVTRGKRNVAHYPYTGNFRYTLQRVTGVIAFFFILWHVFQMHGWFRMEWWADSIRSLPDGLKGAQFDAKNAITAPETLQASWIFAVLYAVGTLAAIYHLANGLWTMGITWGVWTSPRAQRWASVPCAAFGLFLAFVGMGALYGMLTVEIPSKGPKAGMEEAMPIEAPPVTSDEPPGLSRRRPGAGTSPAARLLEDPAARWLQSPGVRRGSPDSVVGGDRRPQEWLGRETGHNVLYETG